MISLSGALPRCRHFTKAGGDPLIHFLGVGNQKFPKSLGIGIGFTKQAFLTQNSWIFLKVPGIERVTTFFWLFNHPKKGCTRKVVKHGDFTSFWSLKCDRIFQPFRNRHGKQWNRYHNSKLQVDLVMDVR